MAPQALPTPQGLPAALTAVSTQMFRDMSGIAQTAQLAQRALEQAMEGATTTGEQSSQNLQQGLNLTKELMGKVVDMNSQFANTLAESGFGAMGMAMGGAGGGAGGFGGSAGAGGGGLMHKGPSQIGALMNSAARLDARPGGAGGAALGGLTGGAASGGGAAAGGSAPGQAAGGGGAGGGSSAAAGGAFLSSPAGPSLQQQVLERAAGLPGSSGQRSGYLHVEPSGPLAPLSPSDPESPWAQQLGPVLQQAAASDAGYDRALQALLQQVEAAALADQDPWPIYQHAFQWLTPAWAQAVDRAVVRINGGQLDGLGRLDKLLVDAGLFPALHGSTAPAEVLSRLDIALGFTDLQAPAFSEGGVPFTVSGRLMQRLPQGELQPLANATVRMQSPATTEETLVVPTDAQGRFSLTVTQGVPDPDFVGVSRYTGLHDVPLHLSALSPVSQLVSVQQQIVVPGRLVVRLAEAVYAHSGDDARSHPANNIVLAAGGRTIWMHFAVTKGGQKLTQHALSGPPTLHGAGHIESYTQSTMHDGLVSVIYDPLGADSGTAYLSVQIASNDGQVAAARADLQFS